MTRAQMRLLARADLARAADLFADACAQSRQHSVTADNALRDYGDHGPQISGCVRSHFPEFTKDYLRSLARNVGILSDAAYAARPPRVRVATMRALASAVAMRDGSGFYGPLLKYAGSMPTVIPQTNVKGNRTMDSQTWSKLSPAERDRLRDNSELSPQLTGLEGWRVEVVDHDGETRRFNVGKSTGWRPCHLEIHNSRSMGGGCADSRGYASVKPIRRIR